MPEFQFRLATLLRLRQSARDECRQRLAEAQCADEDLRDRLARIAAEKQRLHGRGRRCGGPGTVDVDRLTEIERYAAVLRDDAERLRQRREALAVEIQQRRHALLKADQDARSLEKLQDRHRLRHRREAERRESKQLDEAAMHAAESRLEKEALLR